MALLSSSKIEGIETPVVLNVYDLTTINEYLYWFGVGIFHSGIEVHGSEFGFGAHDLPASGIFEVEPKDCPGYDYRCSILLGYTKLSCSEFRIFIERMAAEYHGDTYHLFSKNCNHFTHDVSFRLTGKPIPAWVNRLAHLGIICSCILPESLQSPNIKQITESPASSEDEYDAGLGKCLLPPALADINFVKEADFKSEPA